MRAAWLALAFAALCWLAPAHASGPRHISAAETLVIEGQGFSAPPYALAKGMPQGSWTAVTLPHALARQLVPDTGGDAPETVVTWYRTQLKPLATAPTEPLYLYIPRWKTDGQLAVYGDGRLLYQSHGNIMWNGSNHPLWIALDETADAVPPQTLVLRIERLRATGGAISSLWVGTESEIGWRYRVRDMLQIQLPLMTSAAFLAVGLFALSVWFRDRAAMLYLLFFVISLVSWLRGLHYYVGEQRLPLSDEWFGWLTVNSLFWLIAAAHFFLTRLHHRPKAWLNYIVLSLTVAISIVTVPLFPHPPNATVLAPLVYLFLLGMGGLAFGIGLRSAWLAGSRDGMLLAGWSLLGLLMGVYDWLLQNNHVSVEGSFLGPYAGVGAFVIFMFIMFRRYVRAIDDVQQINASLEGRLQAREAELTQSHVRLREIEQRQTLSQERQRLMQDMHDGLGSSLISAIRSVEHGGLSDTEVSQVLKDCVDDLKLAIDSMEPVEADLLLLLATLRFRLEPRLEGTGIKLRWEVGELPALSWLEPSSALHILRIVQEAFANILKHTRASEIHISTRQLDGGALVTIADNGQGFDVAQALTSGGKGLQNQLRRAQFLAAEVSWESGSKGTSMKLWLPAERLK
jgi:signal transduction histidine kinase